MELSKGQFDHRGVHKKCRHLIIKEKNNQLPTYISIVHL